jgi:preprotein translocase subunit SecA
LPALAGGSLEKKLSAEQLEKGALEFLEKDIANKVELLGAAPLNQFIRYQYLQQIDRLWLDHLENMEGLREAVHLRHYAQKNPLTEYKLEGFEIFYSMIDKIRGEIASRVHLVRIQIGEERTGAKRPLNISASHGSMGAFSGGNRGNTSTVTGGVGARGGNGPAMEKVTVVRSGPKVGRNDPCPCGSGKKYKYCHGR